jgi:hypothetical protein
MTSPVIFKLTDKSDAEFPGRLRVILCVDLCGTDHAK